MVLCSPTKEKSELLQLSSGLMQFPVDVALRDRADPAAGPTARVASSQRCFPFSHPLFFNCISELRFGLFSYSCGRKAQKGEKGDHKWQEREDRVVNLQTVVLG